MKPSTPKSQPPPSTPTQPRKADFGGSLFRPTFVSGLITIATVSLAFAAAPPMGTVYGPAQYVRQTEAPEVQKAIFRLEKGGAAYLLVQNGCDEGASMTKRITSGTIWLNGVAVVTPNAFNQNVPDLSVPIPLSEGENLLQVVVNGKPGSCMVVKMQAPADLLTIQTPLPPVIVGGALECSARLTALGAPVPGARVTFSVTGLGGIDPVVSTTDANGTATATLTGFQLPGIGTLNAAVEGTILTAQAEFEVIAPETVLAQATGNISPGGGAVTIPGVAEVEFPEDLRRPSLQITLEQVTAPADTLDFLSFLRSSGLPAAASDYFIRIIASEPFTGSFAVRLKVPDNVTGVLTPDVLAELYAEATFDGGMEVIKENARLAAVHEPDKRELVASLSQWYFSSYVPNTGISHPSAARGPLQSDAADNAVAAIIRVSVAARPADVFVSGTFLRPDSDLVEAGIRDTIYFDANLSARVPLPLEWPTTDHRVTHPFGELRPPGGPHQGIDIPVPSGTPVSAAGDGVVDGGRFGWQEAIHEGKGAGGGFRIWINHPDGTSSGYMHLTEGSELVQPGDYVRAGQQIALSGHTGHVIPAGVPGSHLHFQHQTAGQNDNPMPLFNPSSAEAYVRQLSAMVYINGLPMPNTLWPWAINQPPDYLFRYTASVNLSTLGFQTGEEYPLQVKVLSTEGQSSTIYDGTLSLRPNALRVVLRWDTAGTDVDLHVTDSHGNHSWYANLCGIPNGCLDHDDVNGFGPETFSLPQLELNTTYTVQVHYYSDHGYGPTTASVQVFLDDELVKESSFYLVNRAWGTVGTFPQTLRFNAAAAAGEGVSVDELTRLQVELSPK